MNGFYRAVSLFAVCLAACSAPHVVAAPSERPNVVFILADDLGYGDLSCTGALDIRTPQIDRMVREGVRFTNFYSNGPECTPTRTAFLTGRYQQRVGGLECAIGIGNVGRYDDSIRLRRSNDLGLPASETSIARYLRRAGYDTAVYGKWHLGYESKFFPGPHGFDDHFGPLGGSVDYFHHTEPDGTPMLVENGKKVMGNGYLTDLITERAVRYLRTRKGKKPFFLYVPYNAPHSPYQGPRDRKPEPKTEANYGLGSRETFAAMVERMDYGVGLILRTLREERLEKGTLVVFCSDNGANRKGRNSPFSGFKGGLYEGGIRVPCVVRWPGMLPEGHTTDRVTLTMDLTVSIANAAGVTPPRPWDGVDILADLAENKPIRKRTVFWRARRGERTWKAVRDGSLKYLSRRDGAALREFMFDLAADPAEKRDLKTDKPEDFSRLKGLLAKWEEDVKPVR